MPGIIPNREPLLQEVIGIQEAVSFHEGVCFWSLEDLLFLDFLASRNEVFARIMGTGHGWLRSNRSQLNFSPDAGQEIVSGPPGASPKFMPCGKVMYRTPLIPVPQQLSSTICWGRGREGKQGQIGVKEMLDWICSGDEDDIAALFGAEGVSTWATRAAPCWQRGGVVQGMVIRMRILICRE